MKISEFQSEMAASAQSVYQSQIEGENEPGQLIEICTVDRNDFHFTLYKSDEDTYRVSVIKGELKFEGDISAILDGGSEKMPTWIMELLFKKGKCDIWLTFGRFSCQFIYGYWSTGFSIAEVESAGKPLTEKKNDQTEIDRLRKEHEEDLCKLSYLNRQSSVLESTMRLEVQKTKSMEEMYLKIINELKSEIRLKDLELAKLRKEGDVKSSLGNIETLPSTRTDVSKVPEIILIDDDQYLNMSNWVKNRFMEGYAHGFIRQDWYPDSQWYDERKAHTIQQQIRDIMTYFLLRQKKYSFILVSGSGPKYKTLFEGERRNAFEYSVTSNGVTKEWAFH